jgi:hypothetical protein
MRKGKHVRWPVRWTNREESIIAQAAKQTGDCPTRFIKRTSLDKATSLNERELSKLENKPHTNEEKLRQKVFDYQAREGWVEKATELQKAAEVLKSSQTENDRGARLWPELMLWGFCLENLLKGLYSKKHSNKLLKDKKAKPLTEEGKFSSTNLKHDLENWSKRAEVTCFTTADQKRILRDLTQIIIHHGRYPVSIQWNTSESAYWAFGNDDCTLLQMIDFLIQEIRAIELKNSQSIHRSAAAPNDFFIER